MFVQKLIFIHALKFDQMLHYICTYGCNRKKDMYRKIQFVTTEYVQNIKN